MKNAIKALLASVLLAAASCQSPIWENYAYLSFPGLEAYKGVMGGQLASLDFGEVKVGESLTKIVPLKNVGPKAIEIAGVYFDSKRFDFHGRASPVFPLRLEPGETTDLLNVAFYPDDNGPLEGRLILEVDDRAVSLALSGTGYWELTLRINNLSGRITSPVAVTEAGVPGQKVHRCVEKQVKLSSVVEGLNKLREWKIVGTPATQPAFENQKSSETLAVIKSHTTLEAEFYSPFNYFPVLAHGATPQFASLQDAINNCDGVNKDAVIVQVGSHGIAASVTLKDGVSLIGGYNAGRTERRYLTADDRTDAVYGASLSFAPGAQLVIAAASSSNTVVEGVTLTHQSAGSVPVLSVGEASRAVVRHVTVRSLGDGAAVFSGNSNFTLRDSLVEGGAGAKESVALHLQGGGKELEGIKIRPLVYRNVIRAATASALNSETFGVRVDFSCYPTVVGNDIYGGRSTGTGGRSYAVHYINNGRGFFTHNTVDAGFGTKSATAFLTGYGTNLYLYNNNISADETALAYGVYLDMHGRVRRCEANGYERIDVLEHTFFTEESTIAMEDLNGTYFIDIKKLVPNVAGTRGISVPASPELVP